MYILNSIYFLAEMTRNMKTKNYVTYSIDTNYLFIKS